MISLYRRLTFRVLGPVAIFGAALCLVTMGIVRVAVSQFVDQQATNDLRWRAASLYRLLDANLAELKRAGKIGDETAARQRKTDALAAIEDFGRGNYLKILVRDTAENRVFAVGTDLSVAANATPAAPWRWDESRRYTESFPFEPWRWEITLTQDNHAYLALYRDLLRSAGISLALFFAGIAGLLFYLNAMIGKPVQRIVRDLQDNQPPTYEGIAEFQYLSQSIATMMAAIREQADLLATTFANMAEGLCVFDRDLRCLAHNAKFQDIYALDPNAKTGDVAITGVLRDILAIPGHLAAAGNGEQIAFEHLRPSGRVIDVRITSIGDGRYVSTHEDITERVQAEHAIRDLNETLEQRVAARTAELARINKELEAFSYSVSHDLRAPLRAINGFASIVAEIEREAISEQGQQLLDRVQRNAARMGQLIDDILDFSRVGRAKLQPREIDMTQLVRSVADELRDSYPAAEVTVHEMPRALGDQLMLQQVYTNLIGNALKFSAKRERPMVEIGAELRDDSAVYFVKDNGVGFEMQYADRLFGVFQRMHSEAEFSGTGVGLAIVKRIIERHTGLVWAESAPDQGAAFFFTLGSSPAGASYDI